jgi:peptidoglycan/LPS O-acetylase OafA/YrhL
MLFVLTLPILYLSGRHGPYSRTIAALALFAIGMATASLRALSPPTTTEGALQSTLALSLFSIVVLYCSTSYEPLAVCLLAASFYLVANGATLFGLLTSRSARRLGDVSFGVYLLQGVVLAAAFGWPPVRRLAELHPGVHWLVVFLAAVVLIALATLTHVYVERQGVAWGRALLRRMRRRIAVEAEVAIQKAV